MEITREHTELQEEQEKEEEAAKALDLEHRFINS
jgi:hypothetical protein